MVANKYLFEGELPSLLNIREHWARRHRRTKWQRQWASYVVEPVKLPALIRMTRIGPNPIDDDNLPGCMKALRDGIADAFGLKDNDPRLRFEYAQRVGRAAKRRPVVIPAEVGCEIQVIPLDRAESGR